MPILLWKTSIFPNIQPPILLYEEENQIVVLQTHGSACHSRKYYSNMPD